MKNTFAYYVIKMVDINTGPYFLRGNYNRAIKIGAYYEAFKLLQLHNIVNY